MPWIKDKVTGERIWFPSGGVSRKTVEEMIKQNGGGSFAEVTADSILNALGYTPADKADVDELLQNGAGGSGVGYIDYDLNVKSVNHRGYSAEAPENTIPAYILSKKKGFKYAECDVSFTSDGVAVLLHDATIDRTSNGSGNINSITYNDALNYDFGSWKSSAYAGTKIPTFEEFIMTCKAIGLHPYIELKNNGGYTQEQITGIVNTVKKAGMDGKVTYISFSASYLGYVKAADDSARLGYLSSSANQTVINTALGLKTSGNAVFVDIKYTAITDSFVSLCAENNLPLEIWTVNSQDEIEEMNSYVTGVTSDNLIAGKILYDKYMTYTVPDVENITLTSISATYTGGSVPVGTSVNSLTGLVVTGAYSNGTTSPVTGYTLSGTIAEGTNTITVSYGGKTTTFTITGAVEDEWVAVTFDESDGYYNPQGVLTPFVDVYNTGILLVDTATKIQFTMSNTSSHYIVFWDANNSLVTSMKYNTVGTHVVDIPANAKLVAVAYYAEERDTLNLCANGIITSRIETPDVPDEPDVPADTGLLYSWDFTKSTVDTVSSKQAVLSNFAIDYAADNSTDVDATATIPVQGSDGISLTQAGQYIYLGDLSLLGKTIEIDVANFDFKGSADSHIRLLGTCNLRGYKATAIGYSPLLWRKGIGWSAYMYTGSNKAWSDKCYEGLEGTSADIINYFSGKTIKLVIGGDGIVTLYADDVLIGSPQGIAYYGNMSHIAIGGCATASSSSVSANQGAGNQCYNCTITGVRIYHNGAKLDSISATYSGGNVPVGTAVSSLTGIGVTAHYSDGSSVAVTGYTLSGTIAEGVNTITVTYDGKTTTINVIGTVPELVHTISGDELLRGGVASVYDQTSGLYFQEKQDRLCYPYFDIEVIAGATYMVEYDTDYATSQMGVTEYTQVALDKIAAQSDLVWGENGVGSEDMRDSGWQQNGYTFTTRTNYPAKCVRFAFRKNISNGTISVGDIKEVRLYRVK